VLAKVPNGSRAFAPFFSFPRQFAIAYHDDGTICRWDTWKQNCTSVDASQTFVKTRPSCVPFCFALLTTGVLAITQVLEYRPEWDARAGVGFHRRDCELHFHRQLTIG
jgi:hypothetical protein